ncbi:MAG: hypothetical protein WDO74_28230 [Pseudomonadota bacterium]
MSFYNNGGGDGTGAAARCAKACYARGMCIICIDFERGALRPKEARRALGEMRGGLDPTHVKEIEKKLDEAEPPSSPRPGG